MVERMSIMIVFGLCYGSGVCSILCRWSRSGLHTLCIDRMLVTRALKGKISGCIVRARIARLTVLQYQGWQL